MTRDTMLDATNMAHQQRAYRRRTMATGEMKEFLSKGAEASDFGIDQVAADCVAPIAATSTRRMSIGEACQSKIYDWEEPRLDIEGFVTDYFSYRIQKKGLEWFEAPDLPQGVQPEHEMMRTLGTIFEERHSEELENFTEQLLAVPRMSFSLYQDVAHTVGNTQGSSCPMNFGRLVGLISFGGMVAAKMAESSELQGQVRNLLMYTSLFIKTRIRQYWKASELSWERFMLFGDNMVARYEYEKELEGLEQKGQHKKSRWSKFGVGVGVTAVGIVGIVICGRMVFGYK